MYKQRQDYKPITFQEFMLNEERRKRYWIRSMLGFPLMNSAQPNSIHHTLSKYQNENLGRAKIISQNVDGLHFKADSQALELHGSLRRVVCQSCHSSYDRLKVQEDLTALNEDNVKLHALIRQSEVVTDVSSSADLQSKQQNPDGDKEVR